MSRRLKEHVGTFFLAGLEVTLFPNKSFVPDKIILPGKSFFINVEALRTYIRTYVFETHNLFLMQEALRSLRTVL